MESTRYSHIEEGSSFEGPKPLFSDEHSHDGNFQGPPHPQKSHRLHISRKNLLILFFALFLALVIGLRYLVLFKLQAWSADFSSHERPIRPCKTQRVRREWRNLTDSKKAEYIAAVQCLRTRPATTARGSLYDDFPYVHKRFGSYSHKSAAFLPWHRYFILLYENSLRENCNYTGALPYWDWVLDWKDVTLSPVFDAELGFGGDGNVTGKVTVGGGRCVVDGPFAGLEALRYDADYQPHCLSRGFLRGELLQRMCGDDIQPEKVDRILQLDDFESFMHDLEEGPHIAISTGIRGDWLKFTVPYGIYMS